MPIRPIEVGLSAILSRSAKKRFGKRSDEAILPEDSLARYERPRSVSVGSLRAKQGRAVGIAPRLQAAIEAHSGDISCETIALKSRI